MMDLRAENERAHAPCPFPELDFFEAYVSKGRVPAEFFLPSRHTPVRSCQRTVSRSALRCAHALNDARPI
jgi:hypothetical protein